MSAPSVIEVQDLRKTYRDGLLFRRSLEALKGVSLRVQAGEVFGLLGPNGAGKTTFVNLLLGIIRKSGGTATVLGLAAGSRESKRRVGYLPENAQLPRHHTALTALEYYGGLSGMSRREVRARSGPLLENVGLAERARDPVKKYSKGMKQRLALAQALLHDPDLLLLDEPTDGLDPIGRAHVRNVLQQLRASGKTIFLNSHLLQEVEMVCDRVAILAQGELRSVGTIAEIAPRTLAGFELELELAGEPAEIDEAVRPWSVSERHSHDHRRVRLVVRLEDQAAVDRCVDALRSRGISVVGLARRRITLEDAFLKIVSQPVKPT